MTVLDRPRLILPGLAPVEPGVERYWVRGGGATVLRLEGGDQLTVVDWHGRQPGEHPSDHTLPMTFHVHRLPPFLLRVTSLIASRSGAPGDPSGYILASAEQEPARQC